MKLINKAMIANGTLYRTLINGEEIRKERSLSFNPNDITITLYGDIDDFNYWLKREKETVNFSVTNTNISNQFKINRVFMGVEKESPVEIIIKLS